MSSTPFDNQIDEFYTNSSMDQKPKNPETGKGAGLFSKLFKKWLPNAKQLHFLPQILSKKERYWILFFSLLILGSVIWVPFGTFRHFTKPVPAFGGSYIEGLLGSPQYINPLLVQANDTDRDLSRLVYSALMKYDQSGNLVPDLAESYSVSADGLEYTFKLKKGMLWHDGQPISADDIIFTLKILQNNDYGSIQRINWQGIEVEKADDLTIKLKLKNKYGQFLNNTTLGILPKHLWENVKPSIFSLSELNIQPVGSGPYKFKRLGKDEAGVVRSYQLAAFDGYHGGKANIKNLSFKFYDSESELVKAYNRNQVEGIGFLSLENFKNIKFIQRLSVKKIKLPRFFGVFFNQNQSQILSDKNIRLALNYGTDKKRLVDSILEGNGIVINSPLLKELWSDGVAQKYNYDREFAKQILENSGWKDTDGDGIREKQTPAKKETKKINAAEQAQPAQNLLAVKIKTSDFPELTSAANELKKQWEEIGLKVEIKVESLPEIQKSIQDRDYEILLFGEVLSLDSDPFSFWHSSQKKDPGLNLALYDNKNADKILEESRQILDPAERSRKYDDFEKILLEDAPAVFLYTPYYLYLPSKNIRSNDMSILSIPSARFDNISQWYIKTKRERK